MPDLANPLKELLGKLGDLLPVVRNNVYHPDFRGSFSLKYILTPLVPELTYSDLVIVDGLLASVEIALLLFVAHKIPLAERDRLRMDLLAYCERDTWATVCLLERLRGLARASIRDLVGAVRGQQAGRQVLCHALAQAHTKIQVR